MNAGIDLSIIIVNYKSLALVRDCITSIYAETKEVRFEIILVDNDSEDDSLEIIKAAYPQVITHQTGYNAGFARANNAGIKLSKGNYILLLNSDTIVQNEALDKTVQLFQKDSAIACGVQLLNADGTVQLSGSHFVKGGLNFLLPLPYLGRFVRYWGYKLKARVPGIYSVTDRQEVDWISGAFLMVRKEILPKSGLLDEDFFMYAEEIEWCSRLRKEGTLVLYAAPKVIHLGGGSSSNFYQTDIRENSKSVIDKKGRQIMLSKMLGIRKQYGIGWFLVMLFFLLIEIPLFAMGVFLEKIFSKNPKYHVKDLVQYTRNVFNVIGHTGRILSGKPYFYKNS